MDARINEWTGKACNCYLEFGCTKCNPTRWVSDYAENEAVSECGHCSLKVRGIRAHIASKHDDPYYAIGPDQKYYSYRWLLSKALIERKPHWDKFYEQKQCI